MNLGQFGGLDPEKDDDDTRISLRWLVIIGAGGAAFGVGFAAGGWVVAITLGCAVIGLLHQITK